MPPGLLQHVLTVLVFWSWVLLLPRLPPWSRSLRLFPWPSILRFMGPWTFAWICCPQLPPPSMRKRDAQHMLLQHRGHGPTESLFGNRMLRKPQRPRSPTESPKGRSSQFITDTDTHTDDHNRDAGTKQLGSQTRPSL